MSRWTVRSFIVTYLASSECKIRPAQAAIPTDPPATTTARPTSAPTTRPPLTTQAPVAGFNCDFGDAASASGSFCGWTQRAVDTYKWELGKAGDTGPVAGPVKGDYSSKRGKLFFPRPIRLSS